MYEARLRRNLRPVIEEHGVKMVRHDSKMKSISWRHIWNVEKGHTSMTIGMLESVADEIGADFLEFFRE